MSERCDEDVYKHGTAVCILAGPKSETMERWVQSVQTAVRAYDVKVDWHTFAGRDVVRCLGPEGAVGNVADAVRALLPVLRKAYAEEQEVKPSRYGPYELVFGWTDEALAFVDPDTLAKREAQREEFRRWQDDAIASNIAATEYLVEADDFARQELWAIWHDRRGVPWKQVGIGTSQEVGRLDDRPVCVCVFWDIIGGKTVGFWSATSKVVDYDMIEAWLEKTFPGTKHQTDACNFHNIVRAIQEATGQQLVTKNER